MRKKIVFFIHTEYHLLLAIHSIQQDYNDANAYEVILVLKRKTNGTRLNQNLDFSELPYEIIFLDVNIDLNKKLNTEDKQKIDAILHLELTEFNFFQEQDPLAVIFTLGFKQKGVRINLFQDGLKPYIAHTMIFSPALWINNIKQNNWIKRNKYPVPNYFSFLNSKMYGFLKDIDQLFLTFPESYVNWKKLPIHTIKPEFTDDFLATLKKVFHWNDSLLPKKERVIFFMNQPMHDDGSFEVNLLQRLQQNYPDTKIYIKYHPITSAAKLKAYEKLSNVEIINSKIPAELFISQLKDSIILSLCSTSMFMNNPKCKFYYTFAIEEQNNIKRLKQYTAINPCKHVISAKYIDEIEF